MDQQVQVSPAGSNCLVEPTDRVDTCLQALESASLDTEVFAALLLVAKMVKVENTDAATRKRIFDAVGFRFINRLLKAAKPDKRESSTYRSLAVTLLACFSTSPELVGHTQMVNKVPVLIEVIREARTSVEACKTQTIDDAYQILVAMATEESPRKILCSPDVVSAVCATLQGSYYGYDRAEQILLLLLRHCGQHIWRLHKPQMDALLHQLASQFKECQDESKFQVCETLTRLLSACTSVPTQQLEWSPLVFRGVSDILMSKVSEKQRDPALCLASLMVSHYGMSWALGPNRLEKKFLLLLIHLACVETRMALESPDHEYRASKESVLVSCFSLLEQCIEYLTCGPTLALEDKQVIQLHTAISGAFGSVMYYLQAAQYQESWPDQPLVVAVVRVLCVWLAEETTALKEQVYQLLPFLIKVVDRSFKEVRNSRSLSGSAAAASMPRQSLRSFASTDLLRLLLPALCHLTAEDEPRARLVAEGGIELLAECFGYHWQRFVDGDEDGDSEIALTTLCSVFLNVTLQDAEAVQSHSPIFKELLGLLASTLAHTVTNLEHLILSFNFAVLGLTLLRTLAHHPDTQNLSAIKKFVGHTLELFRAFRVTSDNVHEVCAVYQPYWADINELWLLGIQVLSECLTCIAWLPSMCLQSGYLQHIIGLLKFVVADTVEQETIIVYSALLGSVANTEVGAQLKQMGALDIARKYKMEELSMSLQMDLR